MRRLGSAMPIAVALLACGRSGITPSDGRDDERTHPTPAIGMPSPTPTLLAQVGDIVLNEVFFYAACGAPECDANRSGAADFGADQFVEIVNVASEPRSLAGIGIHEKDGDPIAPRFTFGSNAVLAPNEAAVVFGDFQGTLPPPAEFDDALLFEVAGGADLDFTETYDFCELRRAGVVLDRAVWGTSGAPVADYSISLTPDLETGSFATHPSVTHAGEVRHSSPGWRQDYTSF